MISIYGSEDGVLNREKYAEYRRNLPAAFEEHIIEGGCHAGFGSYGPQDGDGVPTITGEEQIAETVRLLMVFLGSAKENSFVTTFTTFAVEVFLYSGKDSS